MLVPEIALTPQTVGRFQARFGDTVALLHSALGEGERYDEWRRLRTGEARIAIGPRSAVFAPVRDLGLIVVDEEHDPSYKHEGDPRYDARRGRRRERVAPVARPRDGARRRAVARGSATPRPETLARGSPRLTLSERVGSRPLPPVRGARHARRAPPAAPGHAPRAEPARARRSCCSTGAAGRTSSPAGPAGRCGSARSATSRSCCTAPSAPSPATTAATASGCRERCDACGSPSVARYGAGTERLEAELAEALDVPVFRLDADTAGAKDAVPALLARFAAAPAGLLIGTQMVAKGHDFPDVTLGVVVDADATLRFPDFRAEERTFALIAQLAGRAGRGPARRPRARADDRARRAGDRRGRAARHARVRRRRARAPARARLPAVRRPDPDRLLRRAAGARRAPRRARSRRRSSGAARRDGARPGAAVPAARAPPLAGRGQGARPRARRSPRCASAVDRAANRREHRDVAFSVDVDPQYERAPGRDAR